LHCHRPVQNSTASMLAQTCKYLRARVHASLDEIGLYRGQQFVLCALWEQEGITHSELADKLHVQPATVTNALKRMEQAGLVVRRQDARDRRVSRVYLTDAGRDIRGAVEQVWGELEAKTFAGFSTEERAKLCDFLCRIRENLVRETVSDRSRE
jgi:DNA-binding MarR family transcriptional regulator